MRLIYKRCPDLGQISLAQQGIAFTQAVADNQIEHRIPDKFENFITVNPLVLLKSV